MKRLFLNFVVAATALVCLAGCHGPAAFSSLEQASAVVAPVDYSRIENWVYYGNLNEDGEADLFFVCPTVDMGKNGNYVMSMEDEKTKGKFKGATNMELGIYENARAYVPFYRQVAFSAYSLPVADSMEYFEIAFADVRAAFLHYLSRCNGSRPLILAGFSQGADMVIRLLKDREIHESICGRLVAAYALGWRLTEEDCEACPWLKPASREDDTGCIVCFNSEAVDIDDSILVPKGMKTFAINPLNWRTDSVLAEAVMNKGACFTDYSGNITKEIPGLTGAYIDPVRGTLKCPDASPADYPAFLFPDGIFHIYDYQFFYRNLQENIAVRLDAWKKR